MGEAAQILILDAAKCKQKYGWGEVVSGRKIYACHDAQLDVLASPAKFTAAFAGAQGGKTAIAPLWLMKVAQKLGNGGRYLVVSPTVPMRKNSQIIEHFESAFADTALAGSFLKGDAEYRWRNGVILFRTADNPVSLDGGVYDGVIVDEAAKINLDAWNRIKVRASAKNAPILMVSTPDVSSPIYDEVFNATKPVRDGLRVSECGKYLMRQWASIDRPGYDKEAFEDARRTMSKAMFDRMYRGVYSQLEGLVYDCFSDSKSPAYPVIKTPDPLRLPSRALSLVGGVDFGFSVDPAAVVLGAECEDGIIYIVDELYQRGLNNDELAGEVHKLKKPWEVGGNFKLDESLGGVTSAKFWCDTEDPKAIQTLQRYGINARGKKCKDILPSIAIVDAMFKAGRLRIFDRCVNLIAELKKYQWEQGRNGEYKDQPRGKDDHLCDSLRYSIFSQMVGRRITPLDIPISTPEEADLAGRAALARLGHDIEQQRIARQKAEIEKQSQWLEHLIACEDD